jgi:tRNA threonylcarbamoyladenosine biosynthesis protein TsaB
VGMASAKGLCYALNIPLITLNTLEVLTKAVIMEQNKTEENLLFCPMMDARRMEVYTAIYDATLNPVLSPCALVLNSNSFVEYLLQNRILFFGSGTLKWENISTHLNALYTTVFNVSNAMSASSFLHFKQKQFANLNFVEPFYLKEFATINKL